MGGVGRAESRYTYGGEGGNKEGIYQTRLLCLWPTPVAGPCLSHSRIAEKRCVAVGNDNLMRQRLAGLAASFPLLTFLLLHFPSSPFLFFSIFSSLPSTFVISSLQCRFHHHRLKFLIRSLEPLCPRESSLHLMLHRLRQNLRGASFSIWVQICPSVLW